MQAMLNDVRELPGRNGHAAVPAFGPLLRSYRLAAKMASNELARRAGVERSRISHIEAERRPPPDRKTVEYLARALGLKQSEREALILSAAFSRAYVPRIQRRPSADPSMILEQAMAHADEDLREVHDMIQEAEEVLHRLRGLLRRRKTLVQGGLLLNHVNWDSEP